jgi:hypothetical protein
MQNGLVIDGKEGVFLTRQEYDNLMARDREREIELAYLKQELDQFKRMLFGAKSERFIPSDSGQLSLGFDVEQQEEQEEQETETIPSYER